MLESEDNGDCVFQLERCYVLHISSSGANTQLVVLQTSGAFKGKSASYKTVTATFQLGS
jgi:hypothetical protein